MNTTLKSIASLKSPPVASMSGFIIGPVADCLFIIGAPISALTIAGLLFSLPNALFSISIQSTTVDLRQVLIVTFIHAHLFLVYFRSHANRNIFRLYPLRFIAVPLALLVLGGISPAALGIMGLIGVWWDVYHSSLQTFGFGRIYDAKQKNDVTMGRSLDYWMNLLVYLGPVLAGAHFVNHLELSTNELQFLSVEGSSLNELFLQRTPDVLRKHQFYLTVGILVVGIPFVLYYLYAYQRLQRRGYRVSWQKVWLLIITSVVSIYCWGFRSFIDAFWVMNFFHALQYFAIVAWAERQNLVELFLVDRFSFGGVLAIFWVFSFCLVYGLWSGFVASGDWSVSLVVTTSLLHYWYDGFIWSVKKKQV